MSRGLGLSETRALFRDNYAFRDTHREEMAMAGFLSKAELAAIGRAQVKSTVIAGGAAGDRTVTGIQTADRLVAVLKLDFTLTEGTPNTRTWTQAVLTGEFTITAANTINNAGGTATTGAALVVVYEDLTP